MTTNNFSHLRQGQIRSCYINFAEHLLNAYNPNMSSPVAMYHWSDQDWHDFLDMIGSFGFNIFEFWLPPRLFSPKALGQPQTLEFIRQMRSVIDHAATRNIGIKMLGCLTTVGEDWYTYCPNDPDQWQTVLKLWDYWLDALPGLAIITPGPGDPGGCSRNGCTTHTFIDSALAITEKIQKKQPQAMVELNTWGNPIFGWGSIQGAPDWDGRFIQSMQHTAWIFNHARAVDTMEYLLKRLPAFPKDTIVALNLGFNPDGDPTAGNGQQDARPWAKEIAKTHRILTWDFSLTEGENAIIPHYRFPRLFDQRKRERAAAPYAGGICYTMTPKLNQLSLYLAAQSFINPDADPAALIQTFYQKTLGLSVSESKKLADILPLFEIIPDWGNYNTINMSREDYHKAMKTGCEILQSSHQKPTDSPFKFFPTLDTYQNTLRSFFELFKNLTAPSPDFTALQKQYWRQVYAIYDHLPEHVDPRPRTATDRLINFFNPAADRTQWGPLPGKWVE